MRAAVSIRSPASAERGMKRAYGANTSMISATATAETTPDHCVRAPACWLIAERVSEPEPGMHWKKLPAEVGEAFAQALLVQVELLAGDGGDRLGHRDRLEQPEQRDRERARRRARASVRRRESGSAERRQRRGDLADDRDALLRRARAARSPPAMHDDHDQELREQRPAEAALEPRAAPARSAIDAEADGERRGRARRPPCVSVSQKRQQEVVVRRRRPPCRPSRFFIWSSTSSTLAPGREADDDRVRDVAREIAEAQEADAELDRADHERDQHRRLDALVLARRSRRWRSAARSRSRWSGR